MLDSNTDRLYRQRLISVIYWFINHCTTRRPECRNLVASLIFMTSSITYSLVTLTIDGVTSFSQLIIRFTVHTRVTGMSYTLFTMAESL